MGSRVFDEIARLISIENTEGEGEGEGMGMCVWDEEKSMCCECGSQLTTSSSRRPGRICRSCGRVFCCNCSNQDGEKEKDNFICSICRLYNETTPYYTPQISPSPSIMSFISCVSSADAGDLPSNFYSNDRNEDNEGQYGEQYEDEGEDGNPSDLEGVRDVQSQSQEQLDESFLDLYEILVPRDVREHENQFDGRLSTSSSHGEEEKEEEKAIGESKSRARNAAEGQEWKPCDIDIHNNASIYVPPESEEVYEEEEDDDDEGLPRAPDLLGVSSQKHIMKDMLSEEHKRAMKSVLDGHFRFLVQQLLAADNLDGERWKEIVCSLSWEAGTYIKPDGSEGKAMDPGGYVKVKCVACGHPNESKVIKGVAFKKNVAHKHMPTRYKNPRLLLLGGALEYQRASMSSMDSLLEEDAVYLRMVVEKIEAHHPNVLLVEKTVARYAQELLLTKEISVVLDVKRSRLERIAQCTGARIVSSVDNLSLPNLKHCELFHVERLVEEYGSAGEAGKKLTKTLMFFEGCPKPLRCTILLKGASGDELKRVKRVVQYAVFAAYHLALETSFLADERASILKTCVGMPNKQEIPEPSDYTGHGFGVHKVPAGELKKQNKDDKDTTISPILSNNSLNHLEGESKPESPTGPLTTNCAGMPVSMDVCPASEVMHQKGNVVYDRFIPSSISGLSASLKRALEEALPIIGASPYAGIAYYLGIKDMEFKDSATLGADHCGKTSEEALGTVQLKSEGIIDGQDDRRLLDSQSMIEHKNQDSTHYEEHGFSKDGLTPPLSDQQSILVSFSSHCIVKGIVCERSQLSRIKYYGNCDKSLGRFLRDRLFVQNNHCHSCDQSPTAHAYCYTHQQGKLAISVQQLPGALVLPGEREGKIWMWYRCLRCPRKDGIPQGNRRVVMSDAASGLSFGKFLELSFSNHSAASRVASCGHSLHRDCLRFYGLGTMVACFHYSAINVFGVRLPPPKIDFNDPNQQEWLKKETAEVEEKGKELFSEIFTMMHRATSQSNLGVVELKNLSKMEVMLQKEREEFEESLLKAMTSNWQPGQPFADILELNRLRWQLIFESYVWEYRFQYSRSLVDDEYLKVTTDFVRSLSIPVSLQNANLVDQLAGVHRMHNKPLESIVNMDSMQTDEKQMNGHEHARGFSILGQDMTCQAAGSRCSNDNEISSNQLAGLVGSRDNLDPLEEDLEVQRLQSERHSASDISETFDVAWTGDHLLAGQDANVTLQVQRVANGFLTIENAGGNTDLPVETDSISVQHSTDESIVKHESGDSSFSMQDQDGTGLAHTSRHLLPVKSFDILKDFDKLVWIPFSDLYMACRKDYQKLLSCCKLITEYHPLYLKSPSRLLNQGGARLLLPPGIDNTVIAVYDDEPTSLIAYALSSKQYWAQISDNPLEEKQKEKYEDMQREAGISYGTDRGVFSDSSSEVAEVSFEGRSTSSADASTSGSHGTAVADPLPHTKVMHAEICFGDENQFGKVKYSIICYHAKQFSALRKICCPTEREFIRSLSRCKKWGAQGGKSKVFFAKTLDDRFIIKQVTKTELESFHDFASQYFTHLTCSLDSGNPTCLAKILGIYQVTVKHSRGGKDVKMDLMVMENLLFGKTVTRLYDLKGSLRNRYNPDSSGVLLDQNFIEAMLTSPIFVGNKAKQHLERAVWNDTAFLSSINVMDYSLLVGVVEDQRELVLGIIDFMRQYTWDKHLETWVKASGILGGPKNMLPTVISPHQYKKRFRKAISTYFKTVPDPWPPHLILSQIKSSEDNMKQGSGDQVH